MYVDDVAVDFPKVRDSAGTRGASAGDADGHYFLYAATSVFTDQSADTRPRTCFKIFLVWEEIARQDFVWH